MEKSKYLLSRNDIAIRTDSGQIKDELSLMNRWLNWFNSLPYVAQITTLEAAKEFLSGTKDYHEKQVIVFLQAKAGGELPPNTQPLREAWEIQSCEQKDFSGCVTWPDLVFVDGRLTVPESVYEAIEQKHCIYAKTKQEKALIDRIYNFANELQFFIPKEKDNILKGSGLFDFSPKGLTINLKQFYSLLNK